MLRSTKCDRQNSWRSNSWCHRCRRQPATSPPLLSCRMEALLLRLDQAAQASLALPVWALLAGHSLTAVDAMHGVSPFWLVSWLLGFVAAFGGGTLSALLLQVGSMQ